VRLEPLSERHLEDVAAMLSDPDVLRFTRVPEPTRADFPQQWLAMYESGRRDGTREAFAAVDGDGRFLGLALVPEIDREAREAELGYVVAPGARGRGVATAMLRALTDWAFAEAGAVRIRLVVDVVNAASLRVAERCGYVREGVMRSVHFKGDQRIDAVLLSRLASDPDPHTRDGSGARAAPPERAPGRPGIARPHRDETSA
jgi:RimJ/RimL family protein N-acetyltransferase